MKHTNEIIDRLENLAKHAVHCVGEPRFVMSVDDGIALHEAIDLLKEQEPRVLTLEEVKAFDWDYCYLEEERLPGKEYRAICGDYALTCITWPCVTSMRIQHGDDSYGKTWRCWSARPTDEQRKTVKWETVRADEPPKEEDGE